MITDGRDGHFLVRGEIWLMRDMSYLTLEFEDKAARLHIEGYRIHVLNPEERHFSSDSWLLREIMNGRKDDGAEDLRLVGDRTRQDPQ